MLTSELFKSSSKLKYFLIALSGLVLLFVLSYVYYLYEQKEIRKEKHNDLTVIAKLKFEQIVDWKNERLYEATLFSRIDRVVKSSLSILNNHNDLTSIEYLKQLFNPIILNHDYENVLITDSNGKIIFTQDSGFTSADATTVNFIRESIKTDSVLFVDFYYCSTHQKIHLDVIAPITDYSNKNFAALVFRINPADKLFPMMQRWPSNSRTAETVLIKREADHLRFISPLRHKVITPLSLTIPLTKKEFVGVKGLLGKKGIIEGKDYRMQDVLADFSSVPGTSWYLISKIDKAEIYSDIVLRTGTISLTGLILLMLIASTIFYLYKMRQSLMYKNLFLKEKELNEFQIRSKAITDAAKDAIIMIDGEGIISFWNPAAETIFGYTSNEVLGKNLHNILTPLEYHAQHNKAFKAFKFSGERNAIGKTLELTALTKNKTEISIELGLSAIKNNDEWHAVGIIKDISERKATEEKLRESEEKFRKAFNTSTDSITITRLSDGLILDVNSGFYKLTGFSKTDIEGKTIADLGVWEDIKERDKAVQNVMENGIVNNFEAKFLNKDGKVLSGLFSAAIIDINGEPYLISMTRDITARKESEKKTIETQMMLNRIINLLPVRVFWKDKDFKYLGCNEIFAKDAGLNNPEEMIGKDDYQLSWKEQAPLYRADDKIVIETGRNKLDFIEPQTGPNQELKWLRASKVPLTDADGNIIGVLGTYEDITKSKKIEEALQQSEELFRHSFNYSASGMCIIGLDGKFQRINDSLKNMLGFNETEITKYHFNDITYPEDISVGKSRFNLMLDGKISNAEFEKRYITKNKKIIWCHISTSLVKDANNKPQFFISQLIDITERKEIENALKQSEENYRHIFNGMNDMVFIIDLNGRFVDVNNSVIEKLGYSKEELLLLGPVNIDQTLKRDHIEDLISRISSDKVQYFETTHITKTGEIIPVEIKSTLITYKGSQLILSIARDISDRKKADFMLKASEEKYRTMITQMQLGIAVHEIICDNNKTPIDYRFLDVNRSFEKLTGLNSKDIIGKRVLEILPNIENSWIEKYGYVALTGEPLQFEDYAEQLGKYYSVVAYQPKPMQFAVIIDDITDRKMAEAELVERINEITRFNNLMIGREEKMIELKKEINYLLEKLGEEKKYDVIEE